MQQRANGIKVIKKKKKKKKKKKRFTLFNFIVVSTWLKLRHNHYDAFQTL